MMTRYDEAIALAVEQRAEFKARGLSWPEMIRAVGFDPAAYAERGVLTGDGVTVALAEAWLSLGGRVPKHRAPRTRARPAPVDPPRTRLRAPTMAEIEAMHAAENKQKVMA